MNLSSSLSKSSAPDTQTTTTENRGDNKLKLLAFAPNSWYSILACVLLWCITLISINEFVLGSAHAQSQLRDITVSWDSGHGTINSMSGGTYTEQTGEVVIPMGDHLDAEAFEYLGSRRLKSSFLQPPDTMRRGFKLGDQNSFVKLTYGHWQVQNYAECTEQANQGKLCGEITFVPNTAAINSLVGQTIRSELHLLQIDIVPPNLHYRRTPPAILTATIHGQSQVTLSWKNNLTGEIPRVEEAMEYENLEGTLFTYDSSDNYQILPSVSESKNGATPPKMDDSAGSTQTVDGFEGKPLGETNFEYGTWYIAPNNQSFLFKPDYDAIQALTPGDVVESILTVKITPSSTTTTLAMNTIKVVISRNVESELSWTSGKSVEEVTAVSRATSYPDVTGSIEIKNPPPPANYTVSAMVTETQVGNAADIVNGSLVASSTKSGYKIIGSASTFSYGNWFIKNDNTEFVFEPKATAISALTVGQEINITLEFKIEAMVRGSTTNNVENTQEIMLKISPPLPDITMAWSSSSRSGRTSHTPNVIEITQDDSDDYPLLTGTGTIANYVGSLSVSQNPKEQLNDGDVNDVGQVDFALVTEFMDTRQTKYGLVRKAVTVADGVITNNENYGIWYYLAPVREIPMQNEAIFEFEYKPNAQLINNLQRGDVFTTWIDLLVCSANCLTRDVNDADNDGSTSDSVEVPGVVLSRGQATVVFYGPGDPSLELSWNNEFSGKIRKRASADTNYQDQQGVVETFKIFEQDQINTTITEEKTGAPTVTESSGSQNSDLGFDATQYQGNLVYGSWYLATDNSKFVFRPNSDGISQLRPGETVTSTMSINVVNASGGNVIDSPVTITYTIEAPKVELKWNEDTVGLIRQNENASNYHNLSGIVDSEFLPTEHFYRISISESDSDEIFTAETTNSDLGFEARRFSDDELEYGSWFFAADNSIFVFQPNASGINNLASGETVMSTISVEPFDSGSGSAFLSEAVSISVIIAAEDAEVDINPVISIFRATPTAKAGDTLTFTIESDQNLIQPLEVGITYPNSENQIMWRIPRLVTLDSSNKKKQIQIQTIKRYTAEDTTVDFKVAIANSEDYQRSDSDREVTVQLARTGVPTGEGASTEESARVSVADTAVESILETLMNSNSPVQSLGNSIIPRLSIFSELSAIQEGQNLVYSIVSDVQVSSPVSVHLEFDQIGNVIESPSHQVMFPANKSSINFEVPTIDDNIAESDVTLGIRIIASTEYRLGVNNSASIVISDSKDRERKRRDYLDGVNQSIMLAFMEQSGIDTINVVSERANHVLNQNGGSKFEFGDNDGFAELFSTSNEVLIENIPLRSSLVGQSSFSIELFPELGADSLAEIWGFGNYQTIQRSREEIGANWSGDMYLANVGTDTRVNQNILTGFAYSYADTKIEFDSYDGNSVNHTSEFHGISPYLSWNSTAFNSNLHLISSIKQGRIEIVHDGFETISLDNTMYVFGLGGNKNLSSIDTFYSSNPINFDLAGDAWLVQLYPTSIVEDFADTKLESNQFNIALEAKQRFAVGSNITVFPSLSVGYHRNQDSLQSDSGYEIESAIEFADSDSYTISSKGRIIQNQQTSTQNWTLNSEFDYDKYFDNLGVQIQVNHSLIQSQSTAIGSNWSHNLINKDNTISNYGDENELNFKFGYGISVLDYSSILTPISNLRVVDNQFDRLQIGSRISLGQDLEFGLIGSHFDYANGTTSQQLKLTGRINW